ncbi:MAG: hypothetical protein ABSG45_09580 [Nitrososphaerales archaeon]
MSWARHNGIGARLILASLALIGILLLSSMEVPVHATQNLSQPKPGSGSDIPLAVSVTFHTTGAEYEVLGDFAGVAISATNNWLASLTIVVYATLRSGTDIYVADGTATIAANATVSVFCMDIQTIPAGDYTVTFAAVTTSNQAVSAPTTPISLVAGSGGSGVMSTYANSVTGDQLRLSLSSNNVYTGGTLMANVSEFNTNGGVINVTKWDAWQIPAALNSCPNTDVRPFGIAVYKGHYTAQNVSQGSQVPIFPQVVCPLYVREVTGYLLLPDSDLAYVLPGYTSLTMLGSVDIVNGTSVGRGQSLGLNPGLYTVVAADEWGTLAFLYVQINGLP